VKHNFGFDSFIQRLLKAQQPSRERELVNTGTNMPAVFQFHQGQDSSSELHSGRTTRIDYGRHRMTILTLIEVRSGDYERIGLGDWICDALECKPSNASSETAVVRSYLLPRLLYPPLHGPYPLRMPFNALVMCKEQGCLPILEAALEHLGIALQTCPFASEAIERMSKGHYSALVIDFDVPGAVSVARMARLRPAERRPVVFAMIGARTAISSTFQAGANFVLYKPLIFDQIVRSLRAGRGFMRPDRRRSKRHALETLVYLQFGVAAMPAVVVELSETGLALQAPQPLPHLHNIPLRFVLPGTTQMIQGTGEMIWADDSGRAGMLFYQLAPASRKQLKLWLNRRSRKTKTAMRTVRVSKARAAAAAH
jgi:hypothetical protein